MKFIENWDEEMEDLYKEALEIVKINKRCSVSFLQRKLQIGYMRGAKIQDMLEERGVIGKANGAKPRDIIN
jgi:S-DNA-T family DNA segregation ATPase FtsK/SpoIIIE